MLKRKKHEFLSQKKSNTKKFSHNQKNAEKKEQEGGKIENNKMVELNLTFINSDPKYE